MNKKISELQAIAGSAVDAAADVLAIVDHSGAETRKITAVDLRTPLLSDRLDVGMHLPGFPAANRLLAAAILPRQVTFAADMAPSRARSDAPAAQAAVLVIKLDGQQIATLSFAPGSTTGVFSGAPVVCPSGSRLEVHGATSMDTTLRDLTITFSGVQA